MVCHLLVKAKAIPVPHHFQKNCLQDLGITVVDFVYCDKGYKVPVSNEQIYKYGITYVSDVIAEKLDLGQAVYNYLSKKLESLFIESSPVANFESPSVEIQSFDLPGAREEVTSPCECGIVTTVRDLVIHLNDTERWTREAIADWLDELHDSGIINIEFSPWEDNDKDR